MEISNMGIIAGVKSFLGMADTKVVSDVFDKDNGLLVKAGGFINDLHLSDAERVAAYNEFFKASLTENTRRSKIRRKVATAWIDMQVQLIYCTALAAILDWVLAIVAPVVDRPSLSTSLFSITFHTAVWSITAGIGAFFFGTHLLRSTKYSSESN